jgi:sporulation protein YlmC with PRC-barrel domain
MTASWRGEDCFPCHRHPGGSARGAHSSEPAPLDGATARALLPPKGIATPVKTPFACPQPRFHIRLLAIVALCTAAFDPTAFAATPAATTQVAPAQPCLAHLKTFDAALRKDGFWLDGDRYPRARPGYELRTLVASARILGGSGQQATCESVLGSARDDSAGYAAALRAGQAPPADVTGWRRRQIEAAVPVPANGIAFRSDQLIGASVINVKDDALGSVHDIVMSPGTGKIAYLVIGHGGLWGIDERDTPVPWADLKSSAGTNLLMLSSNQATVDSASQVDKNQADQGAEFVARARRSTSTGRRTSRHRRTERGPPARRGRTSGSPSRPASRVPPSASGGWSISSACAAPCRWAPRPSSSARSSPERSPAGRSRSSGSCSPMR